MMVGIKVRRTWSAVGVLILAILMISATEASACFVVGVASPTTTTAVTAAFDGDAHLRDSNQVHGPNASAGMRRQGRERPGGFRDLRAASRSGVAAKAGSGIVRYSPEAASRNLLGQLGEGFAVTPGGRTVSAHAAERIALGGPGRSPTTLARVDDILNNPTALRYDSVRDTVRVTQGKDFVVVRGSGPGQHIVTVMVR